MYNYFPMKLMRAMVQEAHLKIYARRVVSYFYFSRAPQARAENKANQQCHFKSSRCRVDPLGTDSCRETVPMEPPMSNGSMRHQNPDLDFDETRMILQGASCTIAAPISYFALGGRSPEELPVEYQTDIFFMFMSVKMA
jgi:hypothetical protein